MRRVIFVAFAGLGLAGCGSINLPGLDAFRPEPPSITLRAESEPAGAEARTSTGQACRTPCAMAVPATPNLNVTFTLDRFLPQTVPVQMVELLMGTGETGTTAQANFDPNPVFAQLEPAPPPRRAPPKKSSKSSAKSPPRPAPAQAAPPASNSPFPPTQNSPFPPVR